VSESITVGEYTFIAQLLARRCASCGAVRFGADSLTAFELRVAVELAKTGVSTCEALRFMRKALQLRAVDLAALLGVTPETVSRWETGKLSLEHRALALLGSLVVEKSEGRTSTLDRLRALLEPKPLNQTTEIRVDVAAP